MMEIKELFYAADAALSVVQVGTYSKMVNHQNRQNNQQQLHWE